MSTAQQFKDLGNQAFKENKFEDAAKFYSQAIELNPNDHILYSNRSGAYASLSKYEDALADAEKCISLNSNFAKGYQRKGLALHYLGEFEKAIDAYQQGLAKDPNNALLSEGLKAAQTELQGTKNNPFASALKNPNILKLLGILQKDPRTSAFASDPTFMQLIGLMIAQPQMASQFMQTDPRIQAALSVIMENPEAQQIFFSEFAGKMKKTDGEKKDHPHQQSQKMEEEHTQAQHEQEQEQHHHAHSEQSQQKQHQQPPPKPQPQLEEWEVQKNLGNEEYKNKNFENALQYYDAALQLNKEEALLYNNKAAAFIEQTKYDEALEAIEEGLKVLEVHSSFQKKAKLLARKAKIYSLQNKFNEAIQFYEKSLVEDHVQSVKDELKKLQKLQKDLEAQNYINPQLGEEANTKGGDAFKAGKFPDAIQFYNDAVKRNPKEPKYYCNRATAYMKLMEFPNAVSDLEKCLSLDPKYVKAYVKKANCHFVMKEFHKAKTVYEKGLELDPNNLEMQQGLEKVKFSILQGSGSEEEQQQRAKRAMQDPEIQQILREPEVINLLNDMKEHPQDGLKAIKQNPSLAAKIEKLIEAGVLKTG
ncbi:unnamed protein product (macronuclear) [Paramecium tetraurelia]|uniref:Hsp70-Hsp90 organising protein n=1 Tax=Paramecium tetraurelia TaxID=5888 RepID=A0BUJ1_PARTE|nr:uncharacterized protein GSPATT00005454001 [Paramecium tetraurelia]CAK62208.1 unnamed protein product [Paramecium tetraurelia]|eukprot:XP_001429606.1 hypothetical protein (macronuclear) [Paramecium tetraurelia strain d4-2]